MPAAVIYAILFLSLLLYNRCFGLFADLHIRKPVLAALFFVKALAVPAFYYVYTSIYGGLEFFDSGKFFHDAALISDYAYRDPAGFLRIITGTQEHGPGTSEYESCLRYTYNWDKGESRDYLYNDNRIIIRLHALVHFVAAGSWHVHALFSCLLSFTGAFFAYKALKSSFAGREIPLLCILSLFPALWFYSGGLLKEGPAFFVLGTTAWLLSEAFTAGSKIKSVLLLLPFLIFSLLLKPYVLALSALTFALYFGADKLRRYRTPAFFFSVALILAAAWLALGKLKHKSPFEAALRHQQIFVAMSRGGIFLADSDTYLRLPYNQNLINRVGDSLYTIKPGVAYAYWEDSHHEDTLLCASNSDTSTVYRLQFSTPEAGSNLKVLPPGKPLLLHAGQALVNSLLHPFFFNTRDATGLLMSFENLLLLISLTLVLIGCLTGRREKLLPLALVFLGLAVCVLAAFSAPNSGAIFRYRAPAAVFIVVAGLYFIPAKSQTENTP